MCKKRLKLAISVMAVLVSVNSPTAVLAETIPNGGQENWEEVVSEETSAEEDTFIKETEIDEDMPEEEILSGTGGMQDISEEILQGTGELDGSQVLSGTQDIAEEGNPVVQEALNKAGTYLQKTVTSPVVSSSAGEWSVVAMARGGFLSDSTRKAYLNNLYQTLQEKDGVLHTAKYTEYSRVVIALSSLNIHPASVNGYQLLEPLADFQKVSNQGINGSAYALIALDTKKYEIPVLNNGKIQTTRENLISDILGKELPGGGWALDGSVANPDVTAMVLQSLSPYLSRSDVGAAVDRGIEKLAAMQEEDGGYSSDFLSGTGEAVKNLESTAQVVIALSAVDATLIEQDKFMKNGHTLLEKLLRFQKEDGSFEHIIGGGSDAMATDQGTLALLAWTRAVNGQTPLYDMTDQGGVQEETPESQENIEAFRQKIEALPERVTMADKEQVYGLKVELDLMKDFAEKEEFDRLLNGFIKDIAEQEEAIKKLDERIWKEINPLQITLKDKEIVEELLADFQKIPEANRGYLERTEDLKTAEIIISKLQEGIFAKEIFEVAKAAGKDYLHEEKGYVIRIKGSNVKKPADMRYGMEIQEKSGSLSIKMEEQGELPGEIELSVPCSLKNGVYMLYDEKNQEEQWVSVNGNMACFDLLKGGTYTLKRADMGYGNGDELLSGGGTVETGSLISNQRQNTAGQGTAASKKSGKTTTSNTVEAKAKDGILAKEELETIKDKDKNIKIKGETDKENEYTLTINGKDIKHIKDMKTGIKEGSKYQEEIEKLAEKPYIFSFEEQGDFPGKMQVEMITNQENGQYLLMKYNEKERKAEYIQKIQVENKKTKFIIEKGGDYFIAKKVKTKSLDEIEAEKNAEKEEGGISDKTGKMETGPVEGEVLTGTKGEKTLPVPLLFGGGILLLAGIGMGVWYFRKRK